MVSLTEFDGHKLMLAPGFIVACLSMFSQTCSVITTDLAQYRYQPSLFPPSLKMYGGQQDLIGTKLLMVSFDFFSSLIVALCEMLPKY